MKASWRDGYISAERLRLLESVCTDSSQLVNVKMISNQINFDDDEMPPRKARLKSAAPYITALILNLVFVLMYVDIVPTPLASFHKSTSTPSLQKGNPAFKPPLIPGPTCGTNATASTRHVVDFYHNRNFTSVWGIIEEVHPGIAKGFRGKITVVRGTVLQEPEIRVQVDIHSTDADDLQNVHLRIMSPNLALWITYSGRDQHIYTSVDVTVYLKPGLVGVSMSMLSISTSLFDIEFQGSIDWEIYYLMAVSNHGSIAGSEGDCVGGALTIERTYISTKKGAVIGAWSVGSMLEINGGLGNINITIDSKHWFFGRYAPAFIFIKSTSGNITARMSFESRFMRIYHTYVESISGDIDGQLIHGRQTSLRTQFGSIKATLKPYQFLEYLGSNITTYAETGTMVRVLSPARDSHYQENPLNWTISEHKLGTGSMSLWYPDEWRGSAEGKAKSISVSGDFDDMELKDGKLKARRGKYGRSRLSFKSEGKVQLRIETKEIP